MNITRSLTTIATAAALAGGIGFAYAQTAADTKPAPYPATPSATTPSADSSSTSVNEPMAPNSTATPAANSADNAAAPTERAPKADRG